jgi:hypothetical protein
MISALCCTAVRPVLARTRRANAHHESQRLTSITGAKSAERAFAASHGRPEMWVERFLLALTYCYSSKHNCNS